MKLFRLTLYKSVYNILVIRLGAYTESSGLLWPKYVIVFYNNVFNILYNNAGIRGC